MTDDPDPYSPRPLAGWYYAAAVGAFLFAGLMCVAYVGHVTTDPAGLPVDRRPAFVAQPGWVTGAFAIAAFAGLASAILLFFRRASAQALALLSMVATLIWIGGLASVAAVRDAMGVNDWAVLVVAAMIVWTIFWFARHSRQRGWLR